MAKAVGFLTDVSLCIGCKACEVACKEWNQLAGNPPEWRDSLDNTGQLDAENWRHVKFIEQETPENPLKPVALHMMSDVCKHCKDAPCLNVCPTNAIVRTEFDTVYIKQDTCNGCRDCIAACPYSVIGFSKTTGTVHKCTFCYDRLQAGLHPACATACPTQSIKFGDLDEMKAQATERAAKLREAGVAGAQVYGDKEYGGLHSVFVLLDKPEVYGLPTGQSAQQLNSGTKGYLGVVAAAVVGLFAGLIALRRNGTAAHKEE
jgi:formate dehydrogenase iron-sulfur subunit